MLKNKLIVFSAPSGAGKTTLVKHILSQNKNVSFSISATSRKPRGNEIDGVDYHFIDKEDFKKKIENNDFIEYEEVYDGIFYGTLKSELEKIWDNNKVAIFDIDVVGGVNIKKMYSKNTISIFVMPPSLETLKARLINRGDIDEKEIKRRIEKAEKELDYASFFDKIIINSDLEGSKSLASKIVDEFLNNE